MIPINTFSLIFAGTAIAMVAIALFVAVIIKRDISYVPLIMFYELIVIMAIIMVGTLYWNVSHIASTLP